MKIVMISRSTLFSSPGGDTIQIENTAKYLRILGVCVDIKLTNQSIDYKKYDLMHFFNITRPADFLFHTKKTEIPIAISTIFVDYSEYEKKSSTGVIHYLGKIFSMHHLEYIKVLGRTLNRNDILRSPSFLFLGQKQSIKILLDRASILLPNSESEYGRLLNQFGISKPYMVIPNAIDTSIFSVSRNIYPQYENYVLCAGRIEGLKNQLQLIKAINQSNYKLLIIGKKAPNNANYYNQCLQEASSNKNIKFIDHIEQSQLASIMSSARVHVLASWFETTGLVSLEAAYLGCNIVITDKGDQKEYFEDMAYYCNPNSTTSILTAIENAYDSPWNERLKGKIAREYTWVHSAEKTLSAYSKVLEGARTC